MFDVASFLAGFILATTVGLVFQRIRLLQGPINAPNRPMSTFPDAAQGELTSRGVVQGSYQALLLRLWYMLLLAGVIALGGWVIWQWVASSGATFFSSSVCM